MKMRLLSILITSMMFIGIVPKLSANYADADTEVSEVDADTADLLEKDEQEVKSVNIGYNIKKKLKKIGRICRNTALAVLIAPFILYEGFMFMINLDENINKIGNAFG